MPKTITKEILEWSENFLEIPSKKLGGWSVCPYAKAARLKNEVKIVEVEHSKDFLYTVTSEARTIKKQNKKLVVVACDDFNIEAEELGCYIDALNYAYVYNDVYLMPFHPHDDGEEVEFLEDNLETENEFYMVLIQPYNELEKASESLQKKGYYKNWDKEYYKHTVQTRKRFVNMVNPGFSNFVLEQDGININIYDMLVTGITPNTYYVFSCWVSWDLDFDGSNDIVRFTKVSTETGEGLPIQDNTDELGSWTDPENKNESRILLSKNKG